MDFLFKKVNIASLVFFRIVFGILGFADVLGSWIGKHWIDLSFEVASFQFKYYGFHWLKTLPEPWLSTTFIITMLAGLGIAFGKWYRWSAFIFALGFSYIYFLEKSYYLNHGYLTMVISWWIIFMPLAKHYSLDVLSDPTRQRKEVAYWPLFLLQVMMGCVYFFGGIAKINPDWLLEGQPMRIWLKNKSDMPILGGLWGQEWVAYFMSWGGMLLDLLVVFFLINKRTRVYALFFVLFFHLNNFILFMIGIFPFLSVTLTLLYFEPDFPIRAWSWLEKRLSFVQPIGAWWRRLFVVDSPVVPPESTEENRSRWILKLVIPAFIVLMIYMPLRHHIFPGNVAWTEEGHRYSWRMMLRQKQAYGTFTVKNVATQNIERIQLNEYLTRRQKRKMLTHPDMILQFAHFLRDRYTREYGNEVEVYADIKAKLNGRKYQQYIDPNVNLAKEDFGFWKHKDWVVPLEE